MSKTQEKPTHLTGKSFVPEDDITITNIFESLLSPAKPKFLGTASHFGLTFIGQVVERSSINEEATRGFGVVKRGSDYFSRQWLLFSK